MKTVVCLNGIDLNAIMALGEKHGDEFDVLMDMGHAGNEMHTALRDALAEDKKKQIAATAKDLLALIKAAEGSMKDSVDAIRQARAIERAHLARVKQLELALQYGKETMDMKPLISALVGNHQHTVPASWKSKNLKVRKSPEKAEPSKK